ncbi:hypothetical protein [Hippea alviniae]|uniref:hypothetical protein n=1 Tax=Hippea alviniae TaxID=1279027 RepID=UPI0003B30CF0|nr:hypothetical protein [Hippea alviniae]
MKITIKRLEIIFVIVYFLAASICFFLFLKTDCLKDSLAGFLVSIGDWYLLKFMAKKWLKKGRYSLFDSMIRFAVVGLSIWFLLNLGFGGAGLILGISIIPLSLMGIGVVSLFKKLTV